MNQPAIPQQLLNQPGQPVKPGHLAPAPAPSVRIDCHSCTARPAACGDCVVSFLLGGPPADAGDLDATEVAALAVLADSGLVPPLRLVPPR